MTFTNSLKTFSDLFTYAKSQARIEFIDYAGGRDSVKYWRCDKGRRDRARRQVMQRYGFLNDQPLPVGASGNGRLMVTADDINYVTGQYTPVEIWNAVYSYLEVNYK